MIKLVITIVKHTKRSKLVLMFEQVVKHTKQSIKEPKQLVFIHTRQFTKLVVFELIFLLQHTLHFLGLFQLELTLYKFHKFFMERILFHIQLDSSL